MRKRVGAFLLALVMVCTMPKTNMIKADCKENYYSKETSCLEKSKSLEISDYIMSQVHQDIHSEIATVPDNDARETDGLSLQSSSQRTANSLQNNYRYSASIDNEGEMKFCEFALTEKAKVSVYVQMAASLNADVYLFSYEESSDSLVFVTGSAKTGKGVAEYMTSVLEAGTYYIAFSGQEGTGNFNFTYYQSNADIDYELNDSISTASMLTLDRSLSGVIDNPYDLDYYKLTVTCPTLVECFFSNSMGYSLSYKAYSGEGANLSMLSVGTNLMRLLPGTYYFLVQGGTNTYSTTSTYMIRFDKLSECNTVEDVPVKVLNNTTNTQVQYDGDGKNCYVNGNPVNLNYHYNISSSVASQSYDIQIKPGSDITVDTSLGRPKIVYYKSSTKPYANYSARPAVLIRFTSTRDFYTIHCKAMYASDNCWKSYNSVTVLIDPGTGKIIDIVSVNYFYDIATTGTNSIEYTTPFDDDTIYLGGN